MYTLSIQVKDPVTPNTWVKPNSQYVSQHSCAVYIMTCHNMNTN